MTLILVREPGRPYSKEDTYLGRWALPPEVQYDENLPNVLPYHYDDRDLLEADFHWSTQLADFWLERVSLAFNEIHGLNWSKQSWGIVLMPWLLQIIQIVIDRTRSLETANEQNLLSEQLPDQQIFIPYNYSQSTNNPFVPSEDEKKWSLYPFLLKNIFLTSIKLSFQAGDNPKTHKKKLKKKILKLYEMLQIRSTKKKLGLTPEYLTYNQSLMLNWKSLGKICPLVQLERPRLYPTIELDQIKRVKLQTKLESVAVEVADIALKTSLDSRLHSVFPKLIAQFCPLIFIEGWGWLLKERVDLSRFSGVIVHNRMYGDEVFATSVAMQKHTDPKFKYIITQHGGGYGQFKWTEPEYLETHVSDYFLSWGWESKNNPKVKPFSSPKLAKYRPVQKKKNQGILYITNTLPRSFYKNWAFPIPGKASIELFREEEQFLKSLKSEKLPEVQVKFHPMEWGWYQKERIRQLFPMLKIYAGKKSLENIISQFKLVVHNYNTTTYIETLVKNLPTLIFFNQNYWELRSEAHPFFQELERVGIYHKSGKSAADFINKNFDKIDKWWYSSEVQGVRVKFTEQYARNNKNWVQDILELIQPKKRG